MQTVLLVILAIVCLPLLSIGHGFCYRIGNDLAEWWLEKVGFYKY